LTLQYRPNVSVATEQL